jgi:hypothetical protein
VARPVGLEEAAAVVDARPRIVDARRQPGVEAGSSVGLGAAGSVCALIRISRSPLLAGRSLFVVATAWAMFSLKRLIIASSCQVENRLTEGIESGYWKATTRVSGASRSAV